jgi:hypothetical protein
MLRQETSICSVKDNHKMTDSVSELTEDELIEAVAAAMTELGFDANADDTGGGMLCVVIPHQDGGVISWGTADVTWGAVITDEDGEQIGSIATDWPSESQDAVGTAKALMRPSVDNGAVFTATLPPSSTGQSPS